VIKRSLCIFLWQTIGTVTFTVEGDIVEEKLDEWLQVWVI